MPLMINWIFCGALLLNTLVFLILNNYVDGLSIPVIFFLGLTFLYGFQIRNVCVKEDVGNKFTNLLLMIMGGIGAALMIVPLITLFSGDSRFTQALFVGLVFAIPLNYLLIYWDEGFYTSARNWPTEFFEYYGFMVTVPAMLLLFGIFSIFATPLIACLIVVNLFLAIGFGMLVKNSSVLAAFIVLGVTFLLNIAVLFLGVQIDVDKLYTDGLHMFYSASCLFPFLSMIACSVVVIIDKLSNLVSDGLAFGAYAVVPVICFGLQFLVFHHWKAGLIVFGTLVLATALVIIFFKLVRTAVDVVIGFFYSLFTGKLFTSSGSKPKAASGGSSPLRLSDLDKYAWSCVNKYHAELIGISEPSPGYFVINVKNANDRERSFILEDLEKALSGYSYKKITVA